MKKLYSLVLLTFLFAFMLTACGADSYDDEQSDEYYDESDYDDEAPLTAEDCYEDEFYDPETQSCIFDEDAPYEEDDPYAEEDAPLTAEDCYEGETYDPETQSCFIDIACEDDAECDLILAELYSDEDLADFEFLDMTEADCLPGESYDPDERACYIECDTDAECDQLAEEIYGGLDIYFDESYNGRSDTPSSATIKPVDTTTTADISDDLSNGDPELPTIARYTIDDSLNIQLVGLDESQPSAEISQARHEEIWQFLRRILPPTLMKSDITEYHIFTDGPEEVLAYVSPLGNDINQWLIGIDITDAGTAGNVNTREFVHTTVHEFAHVLTLENDQVPPDTSIQDPDSDEESDVARACTTFYTGEGCALENAYINQFFNKFWADLYYNEFQDVQWAETDEEYENALIEFYEARPDWFVTDYAATNPGEDIAESFTYFVLQEKPTGDTIADQKVRFFYDYPTLVAMRTHIRSELARMK